MDKYQKELYQYFHIAGDENLESCVLDGDTISIKQNQNYNITKYSFKIYHSAISKVEYTLKNKSYSIQKDKNNICKIDVDFNNKIKNITVFFTENIVDPITIKLKFIKADKSIYDEKIAKEKYEKLLEQANIILKGSLSLLNVYFKPVDKSYSYSQIQLYLVNTKKYDKDYMLLATYKVEPNFYYLPIINLATATYAIKLTQYSNKDEVLFSSDFIECYVR